MKQIPSRLHQLTLVCGVVATTLLLSFNNCSRVGTPDDIAAGVPTNKGVSTGNPMSGALLPKVFLNSDYPQLPTGRRVLTVGASGKQFTNCQSAIDAASPGDEVVIDARFVCSHLVLPYKGSAEDYIVIRSANLSALQGEGNRISKDDAANLAIIESVNSEFAVGIADVSASTKIRGAPNHYFLAGLEIRVNPKVKVLNEYIVKLRNGAKTMDLLPHDIVISRSWIHGNPDQQIRRAIDLNGLRISVVDSIIEDVHLHGQSSQGIAAWDAAAGPYKITNNEFVVAGAALLIGWKSSIVGLIPSDIEVRKNIFRKLDEWRKPVTSNSGTTDYWTLSESIVLRSVQRILFDGNTFMNDWARIPEGSNYIGRAFYLRPSGFGQPWARVQDVTITNNILRELPGGLLIAYNDPTLPEVVTRRVQIENNVAFNLAPGNDRGFIWLEGRSNGAVVFNHNTFISRSSDSSVPATIMTDPRGLFSQFEFTNNIVNSGVSTLGGLSKGSATLSAQFPSVRFERNVMAGELEDDYSGNHSENFFPNSLEAVGFFANPSNGVFDYRTLQLRPASSYSHSATEGSAIGADILRIEAIAH